MTMITDKPINYEFEADCKTMGNELSSTDATVYLRKGKSFITQ